MSSETDKPVAHARIKSLPPDKLEAVDKMLKRGDAVAKIARTIQVDWALLPDMDRDSLRKALKRYKDDEITQAVVETMKVAGVLDTVTEIIARLDPLDEMTKVIVIQRNRVEALYEREKMLPNGITIESLRREIELLGKLLKDYADLQLETGLLRRAPKTLTGSITQTTNLDGSSSADFRVTQSSSLLIEQFINGVLEEHSTLPGGDPVPAAAG